MTTANMTWAKARHGLAAIVPSTLVLFIALGFYGYASSLGSRNRVRDYELNATFLSSNGLHPGAEVVLAGVQVGTITSIALDERIMMSVVRFRVEQSLRLPVDTRLSVGSSTLTSGDALIILPGASHQMLEAGANLQNTCELTSLEQQVSQYIFGSGGTPTNCDPK